MTSHKSRITCIDIYGTLFLNTKQPPGCGPVPGCGLFGTGLHKRTKLNLCERQASMHAHAQLNLHNSNCVCMCMHTGPPFVQVKLCERVDVCQPTAHAARFPCPPPLRPGHQAAKVVDRCLNILTTKFSLAYLSSYLDFHGFWITWSEGMLSLLYPNPAYLQWLPFSQFNLNQFNQFKILFSWLYSTEIL